jgi:hypothetical protein
VLRIISPAVLIRHEALEVPVGYRAPDGV